MTKKIVVAVSGINAIDNPGPGTGIIRSLKESSLGDNIRTIGLAYDAMEPGIYMDSIVDKTYMMPYPSGDKSSFIERIKYIHDLENIDIIISALDAELPVYIEIEEQLKNEFGIKMLIPTKEMFKMRDKSKLKDIAEKIGVKIPQYFTTASHEDLVSALNVVGYPCMVKGPFYEAVKVHNYNDATLNFNKISAKWGFPIIVQQFIHGEEYDLVGCGDGKGEDMGLFSIRKMTTTSLGKVWNAVSIKNDKILEAAKKVVKHLNWRGGFEFEVLIENFSQEIYLIEINPRFPAWVYMASACGINLPERMVNLLLGNDYKKDSEYSSGKLMIRHTHEIIKDIKDFETITTTGEL